MNHIVSVHIILCPSLCYQDHAESCIGGFPWNSRKVYSSARVIVNYILIIIYIQISRFSAFFVTVRAGTAYRKIWRLVNNFFCSHNKVHFSEIPIVLSNLLYHYFCHWITAHFNFVISQNAKWGHAGFYIDCHRMTVPDNILLQKKHCLD